MKSIDNKVKKRVKVVLAVLVFAALALQLWKSHWATATIELAGEELNVLVAKTLYQRHKGLGGRGKLAPYDGMIFLFDLPGRYAFVMRDMKFPIDIIWLRNGEVVDIAPNAQPENKLENELTRYYPRVEADLVLEVPAGWSARVGVKIGDKFRVVER